jgi:hypothetical protein
VLRRAARWTLRTRCESMTRQRAMTEPRSIPATTLRRLSVAHDVDPRSILKELREPGSVRGTAGDRCRDALRAFEASQLSKSGARKDGPAA